MENDRRHDTVTMRDYIRVLFRRKYIIIAVLIAVVATVIIGLQFKTPMYEAQVKMLISAEKQVKSPYYKDLVFYHQRQMTKTESEIVTSNAVIERVVKALNLYQRPLDYEKEFASPLKAKLVEIQVAKSNARIKQLTQEQKQTFLFREAAAALKRSIKVEPIRETNLFTISVSDYNPVGAAVIANVVSRSYVIFDQEQQLAELMLKYGKKHPTVRQLQDNIDRMSQRLHGEPINDLEAIGPASVKIIAQAGVPLEPTGIPKILTVCLALFVGLFLGIVLAFVVEYTDQTFKSPQDIETFLNLPFLGSIPKKKLLDKAVVKNTKSSTFYAESYQTLVDQLYLLIKDKNLQSILVASVLPEEGTSTIITNLGTFMAGRMGHSVLIIDANFRSPSLHRKFKVSRKNPGLSAILEDKALFDKVIEPVGPNLTVLSAGNTELNPITLLDSSAMGDVLQKARGQFEIILFDCANLRFFKDSVMLSSLVDGVVLVLSEGKARRQVVRSAIASLEQKQAHLLGVIFNHRTFPIPASIYDRT